MKQPAGSDHQPFILRTYQIWNQLDPRQRSVLTILYQLDQNRENLEYQRLKQEGCCRPSDDWRWIPLTSQNKGEIPLLQKYLNEAGIGERKAQELVRSLEARGLVRCLQDRWGKDDRLFVRILFLGQRVVRDSKPPENSYKCHFEE